MRKDLLRLLRFARPYWFVVLLSVILMAGAALAHAMLPLLVGPVAHRVLVPTSANAPVKLLQRPPIYLDQVVPSWMHNVWTMVAFCIVVSFVVKGLCDYLANYAINYVGISAVTDLRQKVFDKVLRQASQFFEQHSTGRLMSSIMNDVEKVQVAVSHMLADFVRQLFTAAALLFVLIGIDWKLALISLVLLPGVLLPTARLGRRIRRTSRKAQDDTAEVNQILQETLSGHAVVKSFLAEPYESGRFRVAARRLKSTTMRYVAQQAIATPIIEIMGALTVVGLLSYGRIQIKAGLDSQAFMNFLVALLMLYEPVKRLTGIHNIFQQALGASQRVMEYLEREDDICDRPNARAIPGFEKGLTFQAVTFRYPNSPKGYVLRGIDLEVNAGEVVALVGSSGAGKTTLANLVPRFYDVTSGAILMDGHDIRDLELHSLRKLIGIVAQDTFLFNDTVANNIRYGRREASLEEVKSAAAAALADEFISKMPQGYDTVIGERGLKLSGGQRQRLAIARALLKDAPLLILDEATSHLDTESELLVQRALANLMEHRTVIVIAHRLSTVRRAHKIVVLDKGRISELGTHEELVSGGGIYQRLHELQFLDTDPVTNI